MKEKIFNLLKLITPDVYLQGQAPQELPAKFITYSTTSVYEAKHYDNDVVAVTWNFYVGIYAASPKDVEELRKKVYSVLKEAGFRCTDKGRDVPSGTSTHTGWIMSFMIQDHNTNGQEV